ncbi:MAG: hypothetical protein LBF13_00020 [Campylobacteraceae bacterium]|jgi:glutathione peroxidase-family protein|nr:hypothetical protein [Campylobacteraceae bacterium]
MLVVLNCFLLFAQTLFVHIKAAVCALLYGFKYLTRFYNILHTEGLTCVSGFYCGATCKFFDLANKIDLIYLLRTFVCALTTLLRVCMLITDVSSCGLTRKLEAICQIYCKKNDKSFVVSYAQIEVFLKRVQSANKRGGDVRSS